NGEVLTDTGEKLRGGDFRVTEADTGKIQGDYSNFENYFKGHVTAANLNVVRITVRYPDWNRNPADFAYPVKEAIKWCQDIGVYACINLHTHYGQDINLTKAKQFWNYFSAYVTAGVANKDNPNVFFELSNEPIIPMNPQSSNLAAKTNDLYSHVRGLAPDTHLILFSVAQTVHAPVSLISQATGVNWSNASVGFHAYTNESDMTADWVFAEGIRAAGYPIICTEFKSKNETNNSIDWNRLMHGIAEGESRPSSWMHWNPKINYDNATKPTPTSNAFDFRFFDKLAEADIPFWRSVGDFSNAQDIGLVNDFGFASHNSGTYTITARGADIWGTGDEFYFLSNEQSGNETLIAKVESIDNTHGWAKSGLMMRENLNSGSKNAAMVVSRSNGVSFQYRSSTGSSSLNMTNAGFSAPCWVRLQRSGNTFTGSVSNNGSNWTQVGSVNISMSNQIRSGLAVTSHNESATCESVVSNFSAGSTGGGSDGIYRLQNVASGEWLKDFNGVVEMAGTHNTGNRTKWEKIQVGSRFYFKNVFSGDYLGYGANDPKLQSATNVQAEWALSTIDGVYYIDNQHAIVTSNNPRLKDYNGDAVLHGTSSTWTSARWILVFVGN
ncbi:MAG: cellulase family glycosylhydrolase, partial [Verrucomicrobiota bacterium]